MSFKKVILWPQKVLDCFRCIDFLGPLALRAFLVPIFWMAGTNKLGSIDNVAYWFGHSLHLPFPLLLAYLATYVEVIGAIFLALGLFTRWITIPLMITMLVAIFSVHIQHGWDAIAGSETMAGMQLSNFLMHVQSNYPELNQKLSEIGNIVVLNKGVEFAVTYFIMLLSLFFTGAGKYLSIDYWVRAYFVKKGDLKL